MSDLVVLNATVEGVFEQSGQGVLLLALLPWTLNHPA